MKLKKHSVVHEQRKNKMLKQGIRGERINREVYRLEGVESIHLCGNPGEDTRQKTPSPKAS
jgi:hypothetical protein